MRLYLPTLRTLRNGVLNGAPRACRRTKALRYAPKIVGFAVKHNYFLLRFEGAWLR